MATLLCEHVTLRSGAVLFDYPAKSGVRRSLEIADDGVVRAVRALLRRSGPDERLLVCRHGSGWVDARAEDLNAQFKELPRAPQREHESRHELSLSHATIEPRWRREEVRFRLRPP